MKALALAGLTVLLAQPAAAQSIVCAENFYGDVARQIAGPAAEVASIMSNPEQDPHLFEASPSVARALSRARIVVYSGADYDPWMPRLLNAARSRARDAIVVADLVHKKPGDNPHIWYDPATMVAFARALATTLEADDPGGRAGYEARLASFLGSLAPLDAKIAAMKSRYAGTPVTATEPVFGLMAAALGLVMRNERFQLAVMNNTEPAASDVAGFESDLRGHRVRVLIYNSQATDSAARRLLRIAQQAGIPVVGVTETEPVGKSYRDWMIGQLDALDVALAHPPS